MKIALITEKYPPAPGGLAVSMARLANLLTTAGQRVEIFTLASGLNSGEKTSVTQDGAIVHTLGAHRRTDDTLADWFDFLANRHQQVSFDILHAYFLTQAGFLAAYTGRYLAVPSVVSARGNDLDRAVFDPRKASHVLFALSHASAITANSRELARKAQALSSGRNVIRIPNGVDSTIFHRLPKDNLPQHNLPEELLAREAPVIGFVGEARAKKGLATLLLAYREIAAERDSRLLLVGGARSGDDADLVQIFQKQNPKLQLINIPYLDWRVMPAYYSLIDVLALPSLRDGLPNALLEGMACENAIVATPVGGISDVIRDGENGFLVPPGDPSALAAAVCQLLEDKNLRLTLGRAARRTVQEHFSPSQELQGTLAVYQKLLDRPPFTI